MSIRVYYDNVNFRLRNSERIKSFLEKVIRNEKKETGDLNFIFTNDKNILEINKEFLEHDYFTDVISFCYGNDKEISGEIYISIDTVRRNAVLYKVRMKEEVIRIMIHGLLHMIGYRDKEAEKRNEMIRLQEELVNKFME